MRVILAIIAALGLATPVAGRMGWVNVDADGAEDTDDSGNRMEELELMTKTELNMMATLFDHLKKNYFDSAQHRMMTLYAQEAMHKMQQFADEAVQKAYKRKMAMALLTQHGVSGMCCERKDGTVTWEDPSKLEHTTLMGKPNCPGESQSITATEHKTFEALMTKLLECQDGAPQFVTKERQLELQNTFQHEGMKTEFDPPNYPGTVPSHILKLMTTPTGGLTIGATSSPAPTDSASVNASSTTADSGRGESITSGPTSQTATMSSSSSMHSSHTDTQKSSHGDEGSVISNRGSTEGSVMSLTGNSESGSVDASHEGSEGSMQ